MTKEQMIAQKKELEREIDRVTAEESMHNMWNDCARNLYSLKKIFEENGFREDQAMAILLKIVGGVIRG